jgi:hypothetical protein
VTDPQAQLARLPRRGDVFALNTCDPHFDPDAPLTVNGFVFLPAQASDEAASAMARAENERWHDPLEDDEIGAAIDG